MEFYKVVLNNNTFVATHQNVEDNWFEVMIGGLNKKCVVIHIYPNDDYCTLADVHHDKQCSLSLNLPNKSGTRDMIFAGLHLCKSLYPSLKYASFQDESVIKCGGGVTLALGDVYMLLHGKTWYQTYCDALPMEHGDEIVRLVQTLQTKPTIKWQKMWKDYLSVGFNEDQAASIERQYKTAKSWHAFFHAIREDNCKTWPHWIGLVMKVLSRGFTIQGTMWKIDMRKMKIESAIEEIQEPPKPIARAPPSRRMYFGGRKRP